MLSFFATFQFPCCIDLLGQCNGSYCILVLFHVFGGEKGDGFEHLGADFDAGPKDWLPFFHLLAEKQHGGIQAAEDVHGVAVERDRVEGSLRCSLALSCSFTRARARIDVGTFIGNLVFRGNVGSLDYGHDASGDDESWGNGPLDRLGIFQVDALGVAYYTRLARLILGPFKLAHRILELRIIFFDNATANEAQVVLSEIGNFAKAKAKYFGLVEHSALTP